MTEPHPHFMCIQIRANKIQKEVPLRAVEKFKRKRVGQTACFSFLEGMDFIQNDLFL